MFRRSRSRKLRTNLKFVRVNRIIKGKELRNWKLIRKISVLFIIILIINLEKKENKF